MMRCPLATIRPAVMSTANTFMRGRRLKSDRRKMTDEPHLPRFLVRRDGNRGWMVWDRQTKGPAKYPRYPAVDLTEDRAREIKDVLTKQYIAGG
jgi:hypothetical protein